MPTPTGQLPRHSTVSVRSRGVLARIQHPGLARGQIGHAAFIPLACAPSPRAFSFRVRDEVAPSRTIRKLARVEGGALGIVPQHAARVGGDVCSIHPAPKWVRLRVDFVILDVERLLRQYTRALGSRERRTWVGSLSFSTRLRKAPPPHRSAQRYPRVGRFHSGAAPGRLRGRSARRRQSGAARDPRDTRSNEPSGTEAPPRRPAGNSSSSRRAGAREHARVHERSPPARRRRRDSLARIRTCGLRRTRYTVIARSIWPHPDRRRARLLRLGEWFAEIDQSKDSPVAVCSLNARAFVRRLRAVGRFWGADGVSSFPSLRRQRWQGRLIRLPIGLAGHRGLGVRGNLACLPRGIRLLAARLHALRSFPGGPHLARAGPVTFCLSLQLTIYDVLRLVLTRWPGWGVLGGAASALLGRAVFGVLYLMVACSTAGPCAGRW